MAEEISGRFAALVARSEAALPIDEALLLVAARADPAREVDAELARLDDLAAGVAGPTPGDLVSHLFGDLGFRGDQETYYDPRNSLLPEVLDRRIGIPISLAVVAIEVGRRCGVRLAGIGMPGHFLVEVVDEPGRYLDPFDDGAELDAAGCRALFERLHPGGAWHDDHLRRSSPHAIVARVLGNLVGAYRRAGDRAALCWALELRLLLPGATAHDRRELGVLLGASGRFGDGARVLEASADADDREAAARLRARLN